MSIQQQKDSLNTLFEALHAERIRTWDPEQLAKNVDTRKALVEAYDPDKVVRPGDRLENFELPTSSGGTISLDRLVADGPSVLIFFRWAECPACNLALPYYERQLLPALQAQGVTLVAIAPHLTKTGLDTIRTRHDLHFDVAEDTGNALARRFGISFAQDETPGGKIGEVTGMGTAELPQPAVIIVDQDRIVRFVDVSPDWLRRTEAPEILEALREIRVRAAA
jgi:peroxiredoxin